MIEILIKEILKEGGTLTYEMVDDLIMVSVQMKESDNRNYFFRIDFDITGDFFNEATLRTLLGKIREKKSQLAGV